MTEQDIVDNLQRGELVVMKSDTIYGIFASALDQAAVERLHSVRDRAPEQGFIVLADSVETVGQLVSLRPQIRARLETIWAAPFATSVILSSKGSKAPWLADTRSGKPTICFRVPSKQNRALRELLEKTGPLCAPSANLPDQLPARNIGEAKDYFGDLVSLYVDSGECDTNQPSRIIRFSSSSTVETLRPDGHNHPEDFVITRRRKLYKFAKFDELDTCFHLEEWLERRDEIVSDDRDLTVEIGAGSALFSVELARRHPERLFVAADIKGDRLYQGAREAARLELTNIYFVRSDIARINEVIPDTRAHEVWITFPDPYPRKPDAKHRLTAPRYLDYYRQLLQPNGILNFKTDSNKLFEWSLEQFATEGWHQLCMTRDLHASDASDESKTMTSYEKRFASEGLMINFAQFALVRATSRQSVQRP